MPEKRTVPAASAAPSTGVSIRDIVFTIALSSQPLFSQ